MKNNLITYETYYGISKKVAEIFALILGNAKVYDIKDAVKDISKYDNIICVFAFHGYSTAEKTKEYLKYMEKDIGEKKLGVIGVGLSKNDLKNYAMSVAKNMSKNIDFVDFVEGELRVNKLTDEDRKTLESFFENQNMKMMDMGKFREEDACNAALNIKEILNSQSKKLEEGLIKKAIDEFIKANNTCALATSINNIVRTTPIEYVYYNDNLYFITEGGIKFYNIIQNPNVSVCIYDKYTNMQNLKGLQIQGKAEIVPLFTEEYNNVLNARNLKKEMIRSLPINMNMIKVTINKFEFLNSDFIKMNVDSKQSITKNNIV